MSGAAKRDKELRRFHFDIMDLRGPERVVDLEAIEGQVAPPRAEAARMEVRGLEAAHARQPRALGVLAGATLGARVLATTRSALLRMIFAIVVAVLGVEMIVNGLHGRV